MKDNFWFLGLLGFLVSSLISIFWNKITAGIFGLNFETDDSEE